MKVFNYSCQKVFHSAGIRFRILQVFDSSGILASRKARNRCSLPIKATKDAQGWPRGEFFFNSSLNYFSRRLPNNSVTVSEISLGRGSYGNVLKGTYQVKDGEVIDVAVKVYHRRYVMINLKSCRNVAL